MIVNTKAKQETKRIQIKSNIERQYLKYVESKNHPCIMAKSVFKAGDYTLKTYGSILKESSAKKINRDLFNFLEHYDFEDNKFRSFVACFENDEFQSELKFEKALWDFLQNLHNYDDKPWDSSVSDCPDDPDFSFSIQGRAFYVVGLHPKSSRIARRSPYVTVVFNLHHQFENLREMGVFQNVRDRIRKNDRQIQGNINPVLRDFGTDTETKQYSGRQVEDHWKCPFHKK